MKFEIKDGQNIISIGLNDIGSYFSYNNPLTTVWYDCRGSVGKYLCQLPYDQKYRDEVRNKILENLNIDYSDKIEELYTLIHPLLRLFPNGEYFLNFYKSQNSQYFEYSYLRDGISTTYKYHWFFMFAETTNLAEIDKKILEHRAFVRESQEKGQIYWDILEFTTPGFYEGNDKSFIATQPKSEINEERVKYFEDKIDKGERPFILIFNSNLTEYITNIDNSVSQFSMNSESYVLDGHHKLLAYQNLKINPSIVEITHQPKTKDEIQFDIEKLIDLMYPWQIEHILENWNSRDEYIQEALKNPKSKIHDFIKNGFHKEFHENGQIKHKAFYVNNRIEGEGKWWFDNGQLQKIEFYKNRIRCKTWINWYKSGQIHYEHPFNENGQMDGHVVSYFENGKISSEQFIKNGVNLDGNSCSFWYENGNKKSEVKYINGKLIVRKSYNESGQLIDFEGFDFKLNKLVQRKIKQRPT